MTHITHPNQHERNEWSRMASACYATGHNATGHRFSAAAAWPDVMPSARFHSLMTDYRAWLVFNEYP